MKGYVGWNYLYSGGEDSSVRFDFKAPDTGPFDIRVAYQPHQNRGSHVPVTIATGSQTESLKIDMKQQPPLENGFISVGTFDLKKGEAVSVTISAKNAGGLAHADAVQILRVE